MTYDLTPAFTLITAYEGCVLSSYQDETGVWTIGYGTTYGVRPGQNITHEDAISLMRGDVVTRSTVISNFIRVPFTNNQLCALISLAYNIGNRALETSDLLKDMNAGDHPENAATHFMSWTKAGGLILTGLVRRRRAEAALFVKPGPFISPVDEVK